MWMLLKVVDLYGTIWWIVLKFSEILCAGCCRCCRYVLWALYMVKHSEVSCGYCCGDVALRLDSVHKQFQSGKISQNVLDGVDFVAKFGEVIGIVGPSGAGKSTLLHIGGLIDVPDSGAVLVCGRECTSLSEDVRALVRRKHIGFVYQFHNLLPEFTVLENIAIPQLISRVPKKIAQQRARKILDEMGMAEHAGKFVCELSGGEQQRVAIARGMINNPALILADEPTGNLDPNNALTALDMLIGAARIRGSAVIVVTHNLELVSKMDRVLRLEHGHLVDACYTDAL